MESRVHRSSPNLLMFNLLPNRSKIWFLGRSLGWWDKPWVKGPWDPVKLGTVFAVSGLVLIYSPCLKRIVLPVSLVVLLGVREASDDIGSSYLLSSMSPLIVTLKLGFVVLHSQFCASFLTEEMIMIVGYLAPILLPSHCDNSFFF